LVAEVLLVLDRADELTSGIARQVDIPNCRYIEVDNGDLGLSRNSGIRSAFGEWVAFLDGDDLWAENWLVEAIAADQSESRKCVWHPRANIYFSESRNWIFAHPDMDSPNFDLSKLLVKNLWTALSFGKRKIYEAHPYRRNDLKSQLGYEDWCWNCHTVAAGIVHKTVERSVHFIRQKRVSLLTESHGSNVFVSPHPLFRAYVDPDSLIHARRTQDALSPDRSHRN
jgi:glycosyltransferase involved in cell wall biosynthesis